MSYVPILKGKEGEFAALEELAIGVKQRITPLIEVPDIPYDFVNERASKTLDAHVAGIANRLRRCWFPDRDIYVQLPWCDGREDDERLTDGNHVFTHVLNDAQGQYVKIVPVITSTSSRGYLEAVKAYIGGSRSAVCIRLALRNFDEEQQDNFPLGDTVTRLLEMAGADRAEAVDVIVDLAEIKSNSTIVARAVVGDLPRRNWRRRVVAAASFPENLSDVERGSVQKLPRHEWALWARLHARGVLGEDFMYGDYGISNPTTTEVDPRTMRMSASIRYTTLDDWLVLKGKNVRDYGFEQYHELCRTLIERDEYSGRRFSWGDQFIYDCAHRTMGPGNATTWRKVGTNHHLTLVVQSLSIPAAP